MKRGNEIMDEEKPKVTAADKLKELKSQEVVLKKQMANEKKEAKEIRKRDIAHRNEVLAKTAETIEKVQKEIFAYKRLGKSEKMNYSIKEKIAKLCDPYLESAKPQVEAEKPTA